MNGIAIRTVELLCASPFVEVPGTSSGTNSGGGCSRKIGIQAPKENRFLFFSRKNSD